MNTKQALEQLDDILVATAADYQVYLDRLHRVHEIEDVQVQPDSRHRNGYNPSKKSPTGFFRKKADSNRAHRGPANNQDNGQEPISAREQVLKAISQMTLVVNSNAKAMNGAAAAEPNTPQPHSGLHLVDWLARKLRGRRPQRRATGATMKASVVLELEIECFCRDHATTIAREVGSVLKRDPIRRDLAEMLRAKGVKIVGSQVGVTG